MTAVPRLRRMAMLSVHTSPLDQPGTGDAGGMNVYVVETAQRLAAARGRGRDLHPGHDRRPAARSPSWRPGVMVRHVTAGPVRGAGQGGPARPAVRLHRRRDAGRGRASPRAGTTSCTPTTGSPARSAGSPPSAGACRSCTRCTPWPGSRTPSSPTATPPSRRAARSARRRSSRPPTGWWPTPTTRPASWSSCTTPTPARSGWCTPGVDLDAVHPRRPGRRPAPRSASAPAPACCCSSAGSSRSRPRTCCCAPPPSCSRAGPSCAPAWSSRCSAARAAPAWHTPRQLERLAARWASTTWSGSCRRSPGTQLVAVVPRGRPGRRPVVQRVVRAGRARGAGVRHPRRRRRRRRAADRASRRTSGVLVPGHEPAAGHARWSGLLDDDARRRDARRPGASPTPRSSAGTRPPAELLEVCRRRPSSDRAADATALRPQRPRPAGSKLGAGQPSAGEPPTEAAVRAFLDDAGLEWELGGRPRRVASSRCPASKKLRDRVLAGRDRAVAVGVGVRRAPPGREPRGGLPLPAAPQPAAVRRRLRRSTDRATSTSSAGSRCRRSTPTSSTSSSACVLDVADGSFDKLLELGFLDVDAARSGPGGSRGASPPATSRPSPLADLAASSATTGRRSQPGR